VAKKKAANRTQGRTPLANKRIRLGGFSEAEAGAGQHTGDAKIFVSRCSGQVADWLLLL